MKRSRSLSEPARKILSALLDAGNAWSHGYELCRQTGVKSGTLYPFLIRLEEEGYLNSEWRQPTQRGRPPRHTYRLTASGVLLAQKNPPQSVRTRSGNGRPALI
ncbi:MAG: PadR family transcriptional regulator [Pseudomonadota bacterium]